MSLPKLMLPDEVAEYLEVTTATLDRWRSTGIGPNYVKVGGSIRYPETALAEYLNSQLQLPTEAQKMQAALLEGRAGVREVQKQRTADMQALDAEDRNVTQANTVAGVTELQMGFAGQAPGAQMVRHFNVPPVSFSNAPAVAVAQAQNGKVPVPK